LLDNSPAKLAASAAAGAAAAVGGTTTPPYEYMPANVNVGSLKNMRVKHFVEDVKTYSKYN
jgi:hypothetical protein